MDLYETEEQQVEAVKKWWKKNGTSLIMGAAIGFSAIAGWKYYQTDQANHKLQASDMYVSLVNQVLENKDESDLNAQVDYLASNYVDTPYAAMASLVLAKHDYESGNVQAAISKLSWASKNANDIETQQVATTRLIRIYLSENMLDKAEALLSTEHPGSFDASYEELKGDLFVDKKEIDKARVAYDKAIALYGADVNGWLRLKRQNLGN